MKQEERTRLTRKKIIDAALLEFGEGSYAEASINAVCVQDGLCKGVVYHHFTDKDALYLACVTECFDAIVNYLMAHLPPPCKDPSLDLQNYFALRQQFFNQNPQYQKFFNQVFISTPQHLRNAVETIRLRFDKFNIAVLTSILEANALRPGISLDEVAEIYMALQHFLLNSERMRKATADRPEERELLVMRWIDILLHGIMELT